MKFFVSTCLAGYCLLLLVACSEAPAIHTESQPKLVKELELTLDSHHQVRSFPAIVEASEEAELAFRVSGELEVFNALPGQLVKKGDLLAKLDQTDYQIALEQAQANYDLAKSQYERSEKLIAQQLTSKSGFDQIKAQFQVAKAELKSAQTRLAYTELHAPFSGRVAQRFVDNFENVTSQQIIISLQENNDVDIAIQVPEDFLFNTDKETQYQPLVTFEANKNKVFRAKLKEFDTEADSATNTYKIVFSLPRPENFNVLPGMSATVTVDMDQVLKTPSIHWQIPAEAIFERTNATGQQDSFVWIINEDSKLEPRKVTINAITKGGFAIQDGLSVGERIVVAGVHRLEAGETVRIWQKERGL
jgi:RND family efflux transporter MFP subunit